MRNSTSERRVCILVTTSAISEEKRVNDLAILEALDSKPVEWLEKVTEDQYRARR